MTLIATERIKLFSTRSPYWCVGLIVLIGLGMATLFGLLDDGDHASTFTSQQGLTLGLYVFLVLAALSMTTEYRFGTIRSSFLAVPRRERVFAAKSVVIVVLGAVLALVTGFASFYLTDALARGAGSSMVLGSSDGWRLVAGHAALFTLGGLIALAVGTLVRQSAGAITILLLWPLLIERLIGLIPKVGKIAPWLPFNAASQFTSPADSPQIPGFTSYPTPGQGLLIFAGTAAVLWVIALVVLKRRDA